MLSPIDCDEDILISLEHLLEDEGFDTTTAWTGLDALKALHGKAFDLILMSEYLPDMDAEN
jgi:CheY-like chemotaxis protein